MNHKRRRLSLALPLGLLAATAAPAHEGHDDTPFSTLPTAMPTASPGQVEVLEFLWYGCPHCAQMEPLLEAWQRRQPADVVLRREHIVWDGRPDTLVHARLFAALEAMGLLGRHHRAVFDAVHQERVNFRSEPAAAAWLDRRGIDRQAFGAMAASFGMTGRLSRLRNLTQQYRVQGVPVFFVNGRHTTEPHRAGGDRQVLALIDRLVADERRRPGR